jgi:hypothetical protein
MPEKFKSPEIENPERTLSLEEIEQLGGGMKEYTEGLRVRIEEIRAELADLSIDPEHAENLRSEMAELEEQIEGLGDFVSDIEQGNYEEIVVKPGC